MVIIKINNNGMMLMMMMMMTMMKTCRQNSDTGIGHMATTMAMAIVVLGLLWPLLSEFLQFKS